jgi:hypothetical protein
VPFPQSYAEMTEQVQSALQARGIVRLRTPGSHAFRCAQAALDDGVPLMEIQFPPAGLDTVPVRRRCALCAVLCSLVKRRARE